MLAVDLTYDDDADGGAAAAAATATAFVTALDASDGAAPVLAVAATTVAAFELGGDADDANDHAGGSDEWEDEADEVLFRDLKFSFATAAEDDDDDDDDSEYAPSEASDEDDEEEEEEEEDVVVEEEEEASPSGLFARVMRRVGGGRRASVADAPEAAVFEEQDARFWSSAEEKRQWIERLHAADRQHLHAYGCRLDEPARPEAKAQLRREKKAKSAYALVLFALCVAYLVQLVAMYATTPGTVLSVREVADAVGAYVRAIPPPARMYERVRAHFSLPSDLEASEPTPTAELQESLAFTSEGDIVEPDSVVEVEEAAGASEVTEQAEAVEDGSESVPIALDTVLLEETDEEEAVRSSVANERFITDADVVQPVVVVEASEEEGGEATISSLSDDKQTDVVPSDREPSTLENESEYAGVGVQLCAKFLTRLVKSKYDETVKAAAFRACDTAVAMAPLDSTLRVEAHVLRGDLWSLVSEFGSADGDYSAATASALAQSGRKEQLAQEIQLKVLANRWIRLFTQHSYKELRQDAGRVARDAGSSAALRALATDWLLVFKKKKEPFEVLTSTRLWTLQRLEYT